MNALFDDREYATKLRQSEMFGVPPLSVLDGASGAWQERKREWCAGYPALVGAGGREDVGDGGFAHLATATNETSLKIGAVGDTATTFDPFLAEIAYRWWSRVGSKVFDPFAGGPARGLVADVLGREYLGVDIRSEQIEANEAAYDAGARWVAADAATFSPPACDFVFTCPPYGSLEVYSDLPNDLSTMDWPAFSDAYRRSIANAIEALRDDRFACFVVGNYKERRQLRDLVGLTVAACGEAGADYYGDLVYVQAIGSSALRAQAVFPKSHRPMPRHQMVLVFVKGDAREAAAYVEASA